MATCKAVEGCDLQGIKMGFCNTHYAQVRRGARDEHGQLLRILRATYVGTGVLCKGLDCKRVPFACGFCSRHYQLFRFKRIDEVGQPTDPSIWKSFYNPNRKTQGTAGPCKLEGCKKPKVDTASGLCGFHYRRFNLGIIDVDGNQLREEYRKRRYTSEDLCKIEGCGKQARSNFFCRSHASQFSAGRFDAEGNRLASTALGRAPTGRACHLSSEGYILVSAPEDYPYRSKSGLILEHRLVAEQVIGRYLEPHEIVHHKNGDRQDNRPDNLEVLTRKKHPTAHEYTEDQVAIGLDALRHNDPEAYKRLLKRQ